MLFVSVQQNNIELSIQYAINEYVMFSCCWQGLILIFPSLTSLLDVLKTVCLHHLNLNDGVNLSLIQEHLIQYTMQWFGHSFVSKQSNLWTACVLTHYGTVTSECLYTICKHVYSLKIVIADWWVMFHRNVGGIWGYKGLCETIYDLVLCCLRLTCGSECEDNILLNDHEN